MVIYKTSNETRLAIYYLYAAGKFEGHIMSKRPSVHPSITALCSLILLYYKWELSILHTCLLLYDESPIDTAVLSDYLGTGYLPEHPSFFFCVCIAQSLVFSVM